ncbi:serine protease [Patescibacteria group bacterium]|nr:serine protease [Patescibacteria group bacterium]
MVLLAALLTFAGQIIVGITTYYRYADSKEISDAEIVDRQSSLEKRLREIEAVCRTDKIVLENRLNDLIEPGGALIKPTSRVNGSSFSVERVMGSVVEITCLDNTDPDIFYTGSGTIIDRSGLVLTNQHLLVSSEGALIHFCGIGFTTEIQLPPQVEYIAETVAADRDADLAILQIVEHLDSKPLPDFFPAITLVGSRLTAQELKLGDEVFIAGYPGVGAETFTFTQGVVSGRVGKKLIKTSALIDSGTSGGAAFNFNGDYIGLPTAAARGDIGGSLGYLIAADIVDEFLQDYYAGELNSSVNFIE